jgi:hypothetical protein
MLPVRRLRAPAPSGGGAPAARRHGRQPGRPAAARAQADEPSDWWELNEYATILHAERSGASIRLGDPLQVQVQSVDAIRGRVDLAPAR